MVKGNGTNVHDFSAQSLDDQELKLSLYAGKVLLIVNTASKWGLVKQLGELQELYERIGKEKFVVLGFPCNQFAGQEPLENNEIASHYHRKYGVEFPLFAKIKVNGKDAHPLYKFLKKEKRGLLGGRIKWNYTKFLVDKEGQVVQRFAPAALPADIENEIRKLL